MNQKTEIKENVLDYPIPSQILIIGTNGTGKTAFLETLILTEREKENCRILIIVPDPLDFEHVEYTEKQSIGNFSGVKKISYSPGLIKTITSDFKNGLVIFSDCRVYLHHRNDDLHCFMIRRRQNFVNSAFVFYDFADAIPKTLVFATHFVIFKTIRRRKNLKEYILNSRQVDIVQNRVNANSATQPHYFEIVKNGSHVTTIELMRKNIDLGLEIENFLSSHPKLDTPEIDKNLPLNFYDFDARGVRSFVRYSTATGGWIIEVYRKKTKEECKLAEKEKRGEYNWRMIREGHFQSFWSRKEAETAALTLAKKICEEFNY
ncbi:MAG: hypothetical protein M0Q53_11145 [Prolixibacteraceae bacterium]|jgi:hypothetical protein|nr:hypothetical protein [Prolixibacteraceae bacterium]